MKARYIVFLLVAMILTVPAYADFKADIVMKNDSHTQTAKLCLKGDKSRIEMSDGSLVIIRRPDKGIRWMISPKQKMYAEMPEKSMGRKTAFYGGIRGVKSLGTETISGYSCNKYQLGPSTFWVSDKLNLELKIDGRGGGHTNSVTVSNIKRTLFMSKTFEVPKDYKKVAPGR